MIKLNVPPEFAFDYLSILQIKATCSQTVPEAADNFARCYDDLHTQLKHRLFLKVFTSQEYKDLYKANKETFDLIDLIKKEDRNAREVDQANYKRFLAKQALQQKWFSNSKEREIKIGY